MYFSNSEIRDQLASMVSSTTATQHTSHHPQLVHSFSEPYLLSEPSKITDVKTDLPSSLSKEEIKPVITVTTTGSTGTSTNCSTESMAESQSNSTASETLQTSNSLESSNTEVDFVQEAKSPRLNNPVRVHIQYPCSLYQDSNYLPPKKLSSMIEEMIKDGMPRLMRKIVAETKLSYKKPASIFIFDMPPQRQDAVPSYSTSDTTNCNDSSKLVGSVSEEEKIPPDATVTCTLNELPEKSDTCQTSSSVNAELTDGEKDEDFSSDDDDVIDQNTTPKNRSMTLPGDIAGLFDQSNKLQRSNSLMSDRRRMEILRNMSQSVKDRLRRHSSSTATAAPAASSTPSDLDLCPTSTNSSPTSNTPTGSHINSPTKYSVNIKITNTTKNVQQPQASDAPFIPSPKNKVRRWVSFNYGDKTKSKAAQKYMKHMECAERK